MAYYSRISKVVESLPPSGIRQFFDLVIGMPDVVSLGVGEPDFPTPWHICERAIYSIERGYTSYTSNRGLRELRLAICEKIYRKWGVSYDPDTQCLITVGVSEGVDLALRAIINPGDKVLVIRPSYVSYAPVAMMAGANVVYLDLDEKTEFKLHPELLKSIVRREGSIKAMVFNYPCNPTGVSYTYEELSSIFKVIEDLGIILLSDEIYDGLTYDFAHTPSFVFGGLRDRLIYLNGFSKTFAMTGWRIGYVLGPEDIISAMTKIHQYTMLCAPIMGQVAAIEAVEHGSKELEHMRNEYRRRRNFIVSELNRLGLKTRLPEGAFYTYTDISITGMDSMEFAQKLLQEEKVAVVPGIAFSPEGDKFVRISYASSLDKLRQAVFRMEAFLERL